MEVFYSELHSKHVLTWRFQCWL